MNSKNTIQTYINNFRRHLAPYLRPDIGLTCTVHPANSDGAILEFRIAPGIANEDEFKPAKQTVNDALEKIPQHAFGGNFKGFSFGGTNVIMEQDRIILIKGGNGANEWNDSAAQEDVQKILPPQDGWRK